MTRKEGRVKALSFYVDHALLILCLMWWSLTKAVEWCVRCGQEGGMCMANGKNMVFLLITLFKSWRLTSLVDALALRIRKASLSPSYQNGRKGNKVIDGSLSITFLIF